jgi:hypothetical protein
MKVSNSSGELPNVQQQPKLATTTAMTKEQKKKMMTTAAAAAEASTYKNQKIVNGTKAPKSKGWRKAVDDDSAVSDLSESTEDLEETPTTATEEDDMTHNGGDERSEDHEYFEKTLRGKHSKACKAMSVSCCTVGFDSLVLPFLFFFGTFLGFFACQTLLCCLFVLIGIVLFGLFFAGQGLQKSTTNFNVPPGTHHFLAFSSLPLVLALSVIFVAPIVPSFFFTERCLPEGIGRF